jgi:hypothetical protein
MKFCQGQEKSDNAEKEPSKYQGVRLNLGLLVNQCIKIFLALSLYNFFNISSDKSRPYKGQ